MIHFPKPPSGGFLMRRACPEKYFKLGHHPLEPQVGEIGILRPTLGKNTVKYRIDERRPGSLVVSPEIPTQSVDVARDGKTILRTRPVTDTRFAGMFVVRDEQPNGFSHYTPMGRVYEVTGVEDGNPVLEVFDVAAAKKMLAEQTLAQ